MLVATQLQGAAGTVGSTQPLPVVSTGCFSNHSAHPAMIGPVGPTGMTGLTGLTGATGLTG